MIGKARQGKDGYMVPKSIPLLDLITMLNCGQLSPCGYTAHGSLLVQFTDTTPDDVKACIATTGTVEDSE